MVDARGFNWCFHLIWRCLLLVAPIDDHLETDHEVPLERSAGLTESRYQIL